MEARIHAIFVKLLLRRIAIHGNHGFYICFDKFGTTNSRY